MEVPNYERTKNFYLNLNIKKLKIFFDSDLNFVKQKENYVLFFVCFFLIFFFAISKRVDISLILFITFLIKQQALQLFADLQKQVG